MNNQIELRHDPYAGEWQPVGEIDPAIIVAINPPVNRLAVPIEENGMFTPKPIIVFEMN